MKPIDLPLLKEIFGDDRIHIEIGIVDDLELEEDRSALWVGLTIFPDGIKMNAKMAWDSVGPEAGNFQFPSVRDLVLVAFVSGHENAAFVIRRLTSGEDKIPLQAVDGHMVARAIPGKKNYIVSDTGVNLARGDAEPDERLVLGDTFKAAYSTHLDTDSTHTHVGNLGYPSSPPVQAAVYAALKASPVDDEEILSDLAKTEK